MDRYFLFLRYLNEVLKRHTADLGNVQFYAPFCVPVNSNLLMIGCEESSSTFYDLLNHHWQRKGINEGTFFASLLEGDSFEEIQKTLIPSNALSEYVIRRLDSVDSLFTFKESFATQVALQNSLSYVLQSADRKLNPRNLSLSFPSANISQDLVLNDYKVQDNGNFQLVEEEEAQVHMRFTSNIVNLIGDVWCNGTVVPVMQSFLSMTAAKKAKLKSAVELFIRDDLFLWMLSNKNFEENYEGAKSFMTKHAKEIFERSEKVSNVPSEKAIDENVISLISAASSNEKLSTLGKLTQYVYMPNY